VVSSGFTNFVSYFINDRLSAVCDMFAYCSAVTWCCLECWVGWVQGTCRLIIWECRCPHGKGNFWGSGLFREISAKSGILKNTPRNFTFLREICCALVIDNLAGGPHVCVWSEYLYTLPTIRTTNTLWWRRWNTFNVGAVRWYPTQLSPATPDECGTGAFSWHVRAWRLMMLLLWLWRCVVGQLTTIIDSSHRRHSLQ